VTAGWVLVMIGDAVMIPFTAHRLVVAALGLGTAFGLTVAGILLLVIVLRTRGPSALTGLARATGAGFAGAAGGIVCGLGISAVVPATGFFANVGVTLLVCVVVAVAFTAVVAVTDGGDLRSALTRVRRDA
jgi:putative peptidoglycan lipid II flippase